MLSSHVLLADVVDAKTAVDAVARLDGVVLSSVVCGLAASDDLVSTNSIPASNESEYSQCVVGNLADDVNRIIADYLQVSVSVDDLLAMKNRLNQLYAVNGYINTGVQIPDQEITDGVLRLALTPGRLLTMSIASDLRERYITGRLRLNQPFNLAELQTQLKLLERDRRITRIDARVEPTGVAGNAALLFAADTSPQFAIGISLANDRSPSIGSNNARLRLEANNLTGWGDALQGSVSTTRGLDAIDVSYSLPLTFSDLTVALEHSRSDSSVIEQPFADLDVDSEKESSGVVFNWPLIRELDSSLSVGFALESRRNQTSLLGQAFSFSEGALDGESRVSPVRLSLNYGVQRLAASLAAKLTVSYGTGAFKPTVADPNSAGPDGSFTAYLAQVQYARMLTDRLYITVKVLGQYSATSLLSVEKFALGGVGSVRGYRQNQIVRDNALLFSVESNYRLEALPGFEILAFYDWGSGENSSGSVSLGRDTIYSFGAGVAYLAANGFSAGLYVAHGFTHFEVENRNLQDDGIHFRLSYDYRF
jgi:hemolysin activation/secretion protein